MTVLDLVAMGRWRAIGAFRRIDGRDVEPSPRRLPRSASSISRRAVGTLSGGQLQRVLFARLLLQDRVADLR